MWCLPLPICLQGPVPWGQPMAFTWLSLSYQTVATDKQTQTLVACVEDVGAFTEVIKFNPRCHGDSIVTERQITQTSVTHITWVEQNNRICDPDLVYLGYYDNVIVTQRVCFGRGVVSTEKSAIRMRLSSLGSSLGQVIMCATWLELNKSENSFVSILWGSHCNSCCRVTSNQHRYI